MQVGIWLLANTARVDTGLTMFLLIPPEKLYSVDTAPDACSWRKETPYTAPPSSLLANGGRLIVLVRSQSECLKV